MFLYVCNVCTVNLCKSYWQSRIVTEKGCARISWHSWIDASIWLRFWFHQHIIIFLDFITLTNLAIRKLDIKCWPSQCHLLTSEKHDLPQSWHLRTGSCISPDGFVHPRRSILTLSSKSCMNYKSRVSHYLLNTADQDRCSSHHFCLGTC